jgi:hypothetical protein
VTRTWSARPWRDPWQKIHARQQLKRLANRFTNKGYTPIVHFFVVMTGNADFSALPEEQLHHVISLKDFLKFSDRRTSITTSNRTEVPKFLTRIFL